MPERILVVEDDETTRQFIVSTLAAADYDCREAGNGREALTLLEGLASGEEFELILLNLVMPGMDGMDLLERVKAKYPDITFVLESGVRDVPVRLAAMRDGAYDYLLKPFDREQLIATVRRALEYRRLKLENRAYQTNLEAVLPTHPGITPWISDRGALNSTPKSVVTPMAGFETVCRPHPPGGHTPTPATFK